MAINTVLGGSGSPSDLLVISGGAATGNTIVHVTNVGGVGRKRPATAFRWWKRSMGRRPRRARSPFPLANSARALSTMTSSGEAWAQATGRIGSCAPTSWAAAVAVAVAYARCRSRHSPLIRRRTRCRLTSSFRSSGPNSQPMGWCSLLRGNWGFRSSARSTTGWATPTSRMVAPLRLRSRRISPADQEAAGAAEPGLPLPVVFAVGLGALLRPNDPQQLSSLRRSQRQRQSGRLPGRHRSSARLVDRRPATTAPASMAPMATCTPT